MDIISCHVTSSCYVVNFRCVKDLTPQRLFCFVTASSSTSSRYSPLHNLRFKRLERSRSSRTICSLNKNVNSSVLNQTYNSYVLDGEESGSSLTDKSRLIPKVSIPSLPDEENGDNVASISSCFWEWKPKLSVYYETSGCQNVDSPPVLFLPGFGVGSFHYEKQLKDLGRDYRVWALDFLGQGMSLPCEDPTLRRVVGNDDSILDGESNAWGFGDESESWAKELVYSVDLWREQVRYFIEEVPFTLWNLLFFV